MGPAPNWLVVSTTTLPASDPASCSAWSMAPQGTASIRDVGVVHGMGQGGRADMVAELGGAGGQLVGVPVKVISTSCPARDHDRAALPPIRPAPMMAMRIGFRCRPATAGVQHRSRGRRQARLVSRRVTVELVTPDLRQMRYVVEVAKERGFSRRAQHVAQQAVSQQVKAVEAALGVRLFERTNQGVELTAAGEAFVQEAQRTRRRRPRGATSPGRGGEVGILRLAYTLSTVYETLPALIDALAAEHPDLQVRPREVFAEDIERMLGEDAWISRWRPTSAPGPGSRQHPVRRAVRGRRGREPSTGCGAAHLARRAGERDGRAVAPHHGPGYYDAAVAAWRDAGFEPRLDERAAGSAVWGNIARGRGVGLVVGSLRYQLPQGVALVALAAPRRHWPSTSSGRPTAPHQPCAG